MVFTKKISKYLPTNLPTLFVFLYLISFPLAQLLRVQLNLEIGYIAFYASDIFIFLFVLSVLVYGNIKKIIYGNFDLIAFLSIVCFSFIVSYFVFGFPVFPALAYLGRLVMYFLFWISLATYRTNSTLNNKYILNLNFIILILIFVSVFGFLQYKYIPDLRSLYYVGWDDHLNRLAGTFLDPGFTSIFLVFGFLLSLINYLKFKKIIYVFSSLVFMAALGLTYSRAGFVALLVSALFVLIKNKKYIWILAALIIFSTGIVFLPNKEGEGTNLLRLYSINLRLENYQETFNVFKKSPLFGVGYNNLCAYKVSQFNYTDTDSHSCSGSDNGILLILATTGIVGIISFINFVIKIIKSRSDTHYGEAFLACCMALFIHMQYVNSIFYPWVLGLMGVLYSLSRKNGHQQIHNTHKK